MIAKTVGKYRIVDTLGAARSSGSQRAIVVDTVPTDGYTGRACDRVERR